MGVLYTLAPALTGPDDAGLLLHGPCRVEMGLERDGARLQCEDCDDIVEVAGLATAGSTAGWSSLSSSRATRVPVTRNRMWLRERALAEWMETSQSRHSNARSSRQKKKPRFSCEI